MQQLDGEKNAAQSGLLALHGALDRYSDNVFHDVSEWYDPKPPKFWPSTIPYIDQMCGGFYGMTCLAAQPGTGKTLLSIASAIEAAASGHWQVVMFSAEDDYDGFRDRFNRYLEVHPAAHDCLEHFHFHAVGKGQDPATLTLSVHHCVNLEIDMPLLLVFDSINSIVNLNAEVNYLKNLSDIGLWAMFARRLSGGNVSFLITSETNKRNEVKGENLSFWSDVYLKMLMKSENVVDMTLMKTRRTPGAGPMGKHLRNWTTGLFEPEEDFSPSLRVVGGKGYEQRD